MKGTALFLLAACLGLAVLTARADTLLVGNKSEASVSLIDLGTGREVVRAETGEGPHEIAVSADGGTAVVTNYGTGSRPGNTLSVIDVEAGQTVATIDLGRYTRPHGIMFMPGTRQVLVTAEGARMLLQVDVDGGVVEKAIATGQETSHMLTFDAQTGRAYVANIGSGSVSFVDLKAGELLGFEASGNGAEGIALSSNGRDLWVTNRAEDTVSLFDAKAGSVRKKIPVRGFPIRVEVMPDDGNGTGLVLVTSARSGELTIVNPVTGTVDRTVDLGLALEGPADGLFANQFGDSSIPIGIEIDPAGKRVWIAHAGADAVQQLDTADWRQIRLIKTGREPDAMAWSPLSVSKARR